MGNGMRMIQYIVLRETRKNWVFAMKMFYNVVFKNLDATL